MPQLHVYEDMGLESIGKEEFMIYINYEDHVYVFESDELTAFCVVASV